MVRTAILTVEEGTGAADQQERVVEAVRELLGRGAFVEVDYLVVPNQQAIIRSKLRLWADGSLVDLVLTTGGEGLSVRDRTPEATLEVVEREVSGLTDLMRQARVVHDRRAALSRAVVGVRNRTMVLNLPADVAQVKVALGAVIDILPDAVNIIVGDGGAAQGWTR